MTLAEQLFKSVSTLPPASVKEVLDFAQFLAQRQARQEDEALDNSDLVAGSLPKASVVRPDKLFPLNQALVVRRVGQLSPAAFARIREAVCQVVGCAGAR